MSHKKLIGLFGGTFNPPHIGHYKAAEFFKNSLPIEKLIIMPSGIPPHKPLPANSPNDDHRLEMCKIAFASLGEVSDFELKNSDVSYTYNTIKYLENSYPNSDFVMLIGTDMLFYLEKWYKFKYLLSKIFIAVSNRNEEERTKLETEAKRLKEVYNARIEILDFEPLVISSTEIRTKIKSGIEVKEYLPSAVYDYIKTHQLYGY